ncbi:GntR family transcriptional regulator [Kitasatospora nipponensis]|uniref:GntR family transcriptional regulator n=1 Tax=Kitasatospora nipponensis TaxID=258049 RepID=A0ABP4DQK1_9ACTN
MAPESDRTAGPLYRRVAEDLRQAITSGRYGPAGQLPTEAELARHYDVSRGTLRQALAILRTDGLVTSRRGTRRVVLGTARVQSFSEMLSFTQWARSIGQEPGGLLHSLVRRPADSIECEQLRLESGAEVYAAVRLRTLAGTPVMVEHTSYPARVGSLVAELPFDAVSHSDKLRQHGIYFADAQHVIDVVPADARDAKLLSCRRGSSLLRERRRTTDSNGIPVEWSQDHYLPGTVAFSVHNSHASSSLSRHARRSR